MSFGPAVKMKLRLPLGTTGVLDIEPKAAHLKGTIAAGSITGGVIAGALSQGDVQSKVVPAVAKALNDTLTDPSVDASVKNAIKTLFDANQDGQISTQEVGDNTLIKTFLAGDVDVDNDGTKELSLGLGFEVARAVIKP